MDQEQCREYVEGGAGRTHDEDPADVHAECLAHDVDGKATKHRPEVHDHVPDVEASTSAAEAREALVGRL